MNDFTKMENKIAYISLEEAKEIRESFQSDKDVFMVEIEGNDITDLSEYLELMSKAFRFPIPSKGLDGHDDWMRDLAWIGKDKIILIIVNYTNFMKSDPESKKDIIDSYENLILPWWREDVKHFMVGGKTKLFQVYLIN